jgi:hypothetical protein
MKNEKMAQAMSYIDYALIEEANETVAPKGKVLTGKFMQGIKHYGSIAACFMIILGIALITRIGMSDVLLYGESISDSPRTITEYIPRSVVHSVEPQTFTEVSLPLELEFKKATELTLDIGEMIILDKNGDTVFSGNTYVAKGKVSMCLSFPSDVTYATISTNRDYNIVLTKDLESGAWYVNIEK